MNFCSEKGTTIEPISFPAQNNNNNNNSNSNSNTSNNNQKLYYYYNRSSSSNSNSNDMQFWYKCGIHNNLIKPHFHHHPSCLLYSHTPLTIQGDNGPVVEKEDEALFVNGTMQGDDEAVVKEGDEEEPVFVLTDEWRDFFAKSDAKRKAAKKQAKKKGKQQVTT